MDLPKARPKDSPKTNTRRRSFQDPRRSVQAPRKSSLANVPREVLRSPLPQRRVHGEASSKMQQNKLRLMCAKTVELSELIVRSWKGIIRLWSDAAARLCASDPKPSAAAKEWRNSKCAPRRWYRTYPITDTTYFVRADAGMGGRIPGHGFSQDGAFRSSAFQCCPDTVACYRSREERLHKRRCSMPPAIERRIGMSSDVVDDLRGTCQICCDQQNEVIVLPCRHAGMCEKCLRRAVYSKPLHRGGLTCPLCRRDIWEVIRIYDEAVRPQYGYSIMVSPVLAPLTPAMASSSLRRSRSSSQGSEGA
mmetsp:Transcript_37108/g.66655  ORF Transcript_37108/g.66655 Transcript_37108/m.66655 type:complete len:306 (+) Transcript_37108:137-1054(+)